MRLTKNILLVELVHPAIYEKWGDSSVNWIHCDAPKTIQRIRDHFGEPVTINDWYIDGVYKNSGVRLPSGSVGAALSSHKGGFGFDLKFDKTSIDEVYTHIIHNQDIYPHISRIEHPNHTRSKHGKLGRDWLHCEICKERKGAIYVFNP